MTVFQARIHEHLNINRFPVRQMVSIYAGEDDDHMSFVGHLTLTVPEATALVDVLDSYSMRAV